MNIGVMFFTDRMDSAAYAAYGQRLESIGLDTIWVPELFGREPFVASAHLLGATTTVRVGTYIANIYARDAIASAAGARTLAELSGGRFTLGLGVSNAGLVGARGHEWEPPVAKLRSYLGAMSAARLSSPAPAEPAPVLVAAHGPKMIDVAAELSDGLCTWNMPAAHTERTRATIGDGPGLYTAQFCLLCEDPGEARTLARKAVSMYVGLDYYHRAWRQLGFDDTDFADGGSDRLVDTLVAWGGIDRIRDRIGEQLDAGATQVVAVPLNPAGVNEPAWELLEGLGGE